MTWRSRTFSLIVSGLLGISGLFIAAGGLGLAVSVALMGALGLAAMAGPVWRTLKTIPPALAVALLTLGWVCVSLSWSGYDRADQAIKLTTLTPLFILAACLSVRLTDYEAYRQARILSALVLAAGAYFLFEAMSGGFVGGWIELDIEGSTSVEEAFRNAKVTLSRGATAYLMVAGPMAGWLWRRNTPRSRGGALTVMISAFAAAAGFDVEANLIALFAALAAACATWLAPRATLQGILTAAAITIMGAPLLMSVAINLLPAGMADVLPLSWAWRLEIWRAVIEQIQAAPLFGHGLDCMRAMSDEVQLRGIVINPLASHAHNAGLQIWIETGLVGAVLSSGTLLLLARAAAPALNGLNRDQFAGLGFVATIWLVNVTIGYGLWQEWHHAALALGGFAALLNRSGASPNPPPVAGAITPNTSARTVLS